jgi:hypothetical protein
MKALLMHRDRDFDLQRELPAQAPTLTQDLELGTLLRAMAGDDDYLLDVANKALFGGLANDVETVLYRQDILRDCLKNAALIREMYGIAVQAIEGKKKQYFGFLNNYPSAVLSGSIEVLKLFADLLGRLRAIADTRSQHFESAGFGKLFEMLRSEFSDHYFAAIQGHLAELRFRSGVLISAGLGPGNEGRDYVLRRLPADGPNWLERLLGQGPPAYSFRIADRDEAGARALSELEDRGIHLVANALAQSMDHILGFFEMMRAELGFYVGCLNLHERLATRGVPVCFPVPHPADTSRRRCTGLRDASLALTVPRSVVGNDLDADGKRLFVITGANQGGKSSFLRAIGLAQTMLQCGLFVAAESFEAPLCTGLYTHYKREEDATMKSGKLDEELARLRGIADAIGPDSLLLFNESFASTNEREGSEIARQIVRALLERRVEVFFVTHLYDFAHAMFAQQGDEALFLRAERLPDGTRTFRIVEGEPRQTSHGEDVYREVFMDEAEVPLAQ